MMQLGQDRNSRDPAEPSNRPLLRDIFIQSRSVPIKHSAAPFCHGDPGEIGRSRMPIEFSEWTGKVQSDAARSKRPEN